MKSFDPIWLFPLTLFGVLLGAGFAVLTRGKSSSSPESNSEEPDSIHPEPTRPVPAPAPETSPIQIATLFNYSSPTLDATSMDNTATPDFPERVGNDNDLETLPELQSAQASAEADAESDMATFAALNSLSPAHNPEEPDRSGRDSADAASQPTSQVTADSDLTQSASELKEAPQSVPAMPLPADFDLKSFQQSFVETLQRQDQTLQTATAEDIYALLATMVQQRLLQVNLERQLIRAQPRITVEIAARFGTEPSVETHLLNLGVLEQVTEALQQLGINLPESPEAELGDDLGNITGNLLESLTAANQPAIGYGLDLTSRQALQSAIADPVPVDSSAPAGEPTSPIRMEIKFGGYVETYINLQGRFCKRWLPVQVFPAVAYDIPISGYGTGDGRARVNLLRLWQTEQPLSSALASPDELSLKQSFLLVSAAIQDVIRLHRASGAPIETLGQRFALHLHDAALAVAELMHQLVDHDQLEWDQAWSITQDAVSSTFHSLSVPSNQWPIDLFSRLLPRHLEIINEINRRFLDAVRQRYPGDEERVGRMSLVDQGYLRGSHLAWVGSGSVAGITPLHTQLIQQSVFPDFSQFDANKFSHGTLEITPRRFLLQANPQLANLLNAAIGDDWITHPERLQQLETLVNDAQFCGNWWQVKRNNKQALAAYIQQHTGLTVNLNSIFDVQAMPIEPGSRQLLNLLHVITLYARLKTNSSTDTIQRFAHRSVPRTCIFVGAASNHPLSQAIAASIRAVAAAINGDPDVQGRLQVVFLEDTRFPTLRLVYAAADLVEHIPLADQEASRVIPFKFALNGAITIGTPNSTNLEIRQAVDPKNLFLFGMTASEASSLKARGYSPHQFYSADPELQQVINPIASGYFTYGDDSLKPLAEWLVYQDPALILAEYASYMNCQERVSQVFQDQKTWTWMSILTTAHMGPLCSGRSIQRVAVPS